MVIFYCFITLYHVRINLRPYFFITIIIISSKLYNILLNGKIVIQQTHRKKLLLKSNTFSWNSYIL